MIKGNKQTLRNTYELEVERRIKAEHEVEDLRKKAGEGMIPSVLNEVTFQTETPESTISVLQETVSSASIAAAVAELNEEISQTAVSEAVQDVEMQGTASTECDRDRSIRVLKPSDHSASVIAAGVEMRTTSEESSSEEEGRMLHQQINSGVAVGSLEDLTGCDKPVPLDAIGGPRRSSRSVAEKTVEKQVDSEASDTDGDDGGEDIARQSRLSGQTSDGRKMRFQCYQCKAVLSKKSHLNRHIKNIHGEMDKRGRFPCYCCDEVFPYKWKFLQHLKTHPEQQSYRCKLCSKIFKSRTLFYLHLRIHDPNREKKFECPACFKAFVTSNDLSLHKVTHQAEKPYKCSQCPQQFKRADKLKSHLIIHSGLRPFQCKLCEKSFRRSDQLETHIRVHTGERPYSCKICNKGFNESGHLHRHIRTHQGDQGKLHQCPDCVSKFFEKSDCLRHQRSRHKSELSSTVAKGRDS